jgi:hypothetical protein
LTILHWLYKERDDYFYGRYVFSVLMDHDASANVMLRVRFKVCT